MSISFVSATDPIAQRDLTNHFLKTDCIGRQVLRMIIYPVAAADYLQKIAKPTGSKL